MSVKEYIFNLQAREKYAFSWKELTSVSGKSPVGLRSEIARLVVEKKLFNLRQGFYLIIPPRYSAFGSIPLRLYVDKMFKYLDRRYYVSLYTASRIHGAAHQQVMEDYVMVELPQLLDIAKGSYRINFFHTSNWPKGNINKRKSDSGYFNVSSPALTAVDLINYLTKLGGLNRMLANIEELAEEISSDDLATLLDWYPKKTTLQRLGFILDKLGGEEELADQIFDHLAKSDFYPILLRPSSKQKAGSVDNRWKIDQNLILDSDL
ncbi:MAG: type IV toxin-antitoxin system AbiEi family antitoxin [Bacteroidota bacterium]